MLQSDLIQNWDIQILNIIHQGNSTTTIINLYNDHKQHNKYATVLRLKNVDLVFLFLFSFLFYFSFNLFFIFQFLELGVRVRSD